jgi:hypothetical protein
VGKRLDPAGIQINPADEQPVDRNPRGHQRQDSLDRLTDVGMPTHLSPDLKQ